MMLLVTVCCLTLSSIEVTLRPLQGESMQGTLIALNDKEVTFETAAGRRTFPVAALHHIKIPFAILPTTEQAPPMAVELVDDSFFPATGFSMKGGEAVVTSADGREIKLLPRLVRWVRFNKQDELVQRQWSDLVTGEHAGDVLIVRKAGAGNSETGSAGGVVLDQLEGVIHEVNDDSVIFEFDGERVTVARTKLEGVVFRSQSSGSSSEPVCRMKDSLGGVWNVRELVSKEDGVYFTTVAGAQARIPLERLVEVDFSAANLTFLSDLEPESVAWRPYFQSPTTPPSLVKWFEPKRDQGADGSPLTLAGESYEKGLALHSRTLVSYRLTKRFQRLVATVGVDQRYQAAANLSLVISGDDRTLFTRAIKGTDAPFQLELDISNVRRIKILVDFGEDRSDSGDLLYLCNARLVK